METFLYKELKRSSLEKDETRIETLGPYAAALSFILANAHQTRASASVSNWKKYENIKVYRGM